MRRRGGGEAGSEERGLKYKCAREGPARARGGGGRACAVATGEGVEGDAPTFGDDSKRQRVERQGEAC